MGRISSVKQVVDAVMFVTDAATVTGDAVYVNGEAHFGCWLFSRVLIVTTKQPKPARKVRGLNSTLNKSKE